MTHGRLCAEVLNKVNIILSNSSPDPIYMQIIRQIKEGIIKGDLSESEPLPSIRVLAKELQISVITTKRAYEELEKDGFIETVSGKGSFVSSQNKELLKEKRIRMVEEMLMEAVQTAYSIGINQDEMVEMIKLFYEEMRS